MIPSFHWTLSPYQDPPQHQDVAHAARQRQDVSRHHGGMGTHAPCAAHCSNDTEQRRHKHHGPTEIFLVDSAISWRVAVDGGKACANPQ